MPSGKRLALAAMEWQKIKGTDAEKHYADVASMSQTCDEARVSGDASANKGLLKRLRKKMDCLVR